MNFYLLLIMCLCIFIKNNNSNKMAASGDDVIRYYDENIGKYFSNKYGESVSYKENSEKKFLINNVTNFSQTYLNNYYNNYYKDVSKKIDGTCSIVACLGMIYYYKNQKNEFQATDTSNKMFINIMDACLDKGYTKRSGGTSNSKLNNCLTQSFKTYNSNKNGNTEWYSLYDKMKNMIENNNLPLIFDLTNHSTVACGFTSFKYTYTETYTTGSLWWKKTKTKQTNGIEEFVIVNEGWGYQTKSIIPKSMITNIFDNMQICFAE